MTDTSAAARLLRELWSAIDARDWAALESLLHPEFTAEYVHTAETFDRAAFVALNRDYPGVWRASVEELVADGTQGASRTRVHDDASTFFVASFGEERDGLLVRLVEVWADTAATPPEGRPSGVGPA